MLWCDLPRAGSWVGRCSGRIGPLPARIVARSIMFASSRMLPGHSWAIKSSIDSGAIADSISPAARCVAGQQVLGQRGDVGPAARAAGARRSRTY